MRLEYAAVTRKGKSNSKNEDRVLINKTIISDGNIIGHTDEPIIALICDGVGGEEGGEIASQLVAKAIESQNKRYLRPMEIYDCIDNANGVLMFFQRLFPNLKNMATTIGGLTIGNDCCTIFNLGDTRVYRYENRELNRITKDHTLAQLRVDKYEIPDIEHASTSDIASVTKYLGGRFTAKHPYIKTEILDENTTYLVCSDGVYKTISEKTIKEILNGNNTVESKVRAILSFAQDSSDDFSVILLQIGCVNAQKIS